MKTTIRSQAGLVLAGLLAATGAALAQAPGQMQGMTMNDHSEWMQLFSRYWWLIFPIFGMMTGVIRMWQQHARANRTIDIIKSYADQGKDPPPELLAALRDPNFTGSARRQPSWVPVFLFTALAAGFVMFALLPGEWDRMQVTGFFFVALVMAGLAIGNLVAMQAYKNRDRNPLQ